MDDPLLALQCPHVVRALFFYWNEIWSCPFSISQIWFGPYFQLEWNLAEFTLLFIKAVVLTNSISLISSSILKSIVKLLRFCKFCQIYGCLCNFIIQLECNLIWKALSSPKPHTYESLKSRVLETSTDVSLLALSLSNPSLLHLFSISIS